jgi:hypothetical protein
MTSWCAGVAQGITPTSEEDLILAEIEQWEMAQEERDYLFNCGEGEEDA